MFLLFLYAGAARAGIGQQGRLVSLAAPAHVPHHSSPDKVQDTSREIVVCFYLLVLGTSVVCWNGIEFHIRVGGRVLTVARYFRRVVLSDQCSQQSGCDNSVLPPCPAWTRVCPACRCSAPSNRRNPSFPQVCLCFSSKPV